MCCPYVVRSRGYRTLVWSVDSQRNTYENAWKKAAVTREHVAGYMSHGATCRATFRKIEG